MSQTRRTWYFAQNAKRKRSARTFRVSLKMPRLPRSANKAPVMQAILSLALKNKTQHQVIWKILLERFSYDLEMKTREQNDKRQTNGNRAIWLVYRKDTNARGFWLVKRKFGWKIFTNENFRYFALTSYCNNWSIKQCLLHIRLLFYGKTKSPCLDLFTHWLIIQIRNIYRNHFSRSYENTWKSL